MWIRNEMIHNINEYKWRDKSVEIKEGQKKGNKEYCHFMNAIMEARDFFNFVNTGLKERQLGSLKI